MTAQTEPIAIKLKRIRARCEGDLAVLMAPLEHALEAGPAAAGMPPGELAALAAGLAQVAAQAGDMETAVAMAGLQAEIEAIAPAAADLKPEPAEPAETPSGSLAATYPGPLLLGLLAAAAISYGVHVWTQARFAPASLIGWLLSASTTLLSVALTLRLGALLARRLPRRRLTLFSAAVAGLSCLLAVTSLLIHRSEFLFPQAPPLETVAGPAGVATPPTPAGPAAATGTEPPISLWWLGDAAPVGPGTPPTAVIDAEGLAAADARAPTPIPALATTTPTPVRTPPPRAPSLTERYAALLQRPVRLVDNQGETYQGTLTGVSKDSVTLYTEVLMFGQPVPAHRQFLHSAIRSLELQ